MVESSKILTVSYGTFSCTLEGFDDSFGMMKVIAEYFRDLAEQDRYFGAEPPTPDADMLTKIAEREVARRVEAHFEESRLVLRAAEQEPEAPAAVAPVAAGAATAAAFTSPVEPEATPITSTEAPVEQEPQVEEPAMDTSDEAAEAVAETEQATDQSNDDAVAEDVEPVEVEAASAEAEVSEPAEVEAVAETPSSDLIEDIVADSGDITFEDMEAPLTDTAADADSESVAAKLARIRSVVGTETDEDTTVPAEDSDAEAEAAAFMATEAEDEVAEISASDDEVETEASVAEGTVEEVEEIAAEAEAEVAEEAAEEVEVEVEEVASDETEEELAASDEGEEISAEAEEAPEAEAETAEANEETTDEAENTDRQSLRARILRVARPLRPAAAAAALTGATSENDDSVETEVEASDEASDVEGLLARVRSAKDADMADVDSPDDAVSAELEEAEAAEAKEKFNHEPLVLAEDERSEEFAFDTSLSDEDEAALVNELAEVESEVEAEVELEVEGEVTEVEPAARVGRNVLPENDDATMSRILDRADAQLSEPEGNRRRNAIAQLKAAVAATEAARQLGDKGNAGAATERDFRSDLSSAALPSGTSNLPRAETRSERSRTTPLKLVPAQRIDAPEASEEIDVQPRRVDFTAAMDTDARSFAEFAADQGATELEDLLEAAAAYTAFVEGNAEFSRPQIMSKVQATADENFSREDSLRSFGTLLREGRISKVSNGRFQINDRTRFKPEQKAG